MASIKFTYFDFRARGEPSRLLLAYSGQPWEDDRITPYKQDPDNWAKMKEDLAYGQLPKLDWDGSVIYTSLAISRFLANKFGLMGSNDVESAHVDELIDVIQDTVVAGYKAFFFQKDEKDQQTHVTQTIPTMLQLVEKRFVSRGGQYLVGNALSWADIQLFWFCNENSPDLAKTPNIETLVKTVEDLPNIKQWIENRPKTAI